MTHTAISPDTIVPAPARPIFLIGFMAAGKSTVGPALAARLQCPFIDLDDWIVAEAGCSIPQLIAREGEEAFRRLETKQLQRTATMTNAVIAPGGGAITRAENRAILAHGITIWLDAPFDLCWRRIVADGATRPLAPDVTTAHTRYEARLPLYQAAATLRIPLHDAQDTNTIVAACLQQLRLLELKP